MPRLFLGLWSCCLYFLVVIVISQCICNSSSATSRVLRVQWAFSNLILTWRLFVCVLFQKTLTFGGLHFLAAGVHHCAETPIHAIVRASPSGHIWGGPLISDINRACGGPGPSPQEWHPAIYPESLIVPAISHPRVRNNGWVASNRNLFIPLLVFKCHSHQTLFFWILKGRPGGSGSRPDCSDRVCWIYAASPRKHSFVVNLTALFFDIGADGPCHQTCAERTRVWVNANWRLLPVKRRTLVGRHRARPLVSCGWLLKLWHLRRGHTLLMCGSLSLVVWGLPQASKPRRVVVLLGLITSILDAQLLLPTLVVFLGRLLDTPLHRQRLPLRVLNSGRFFDFLLLLLKLYFVFRFVGLYHGLKNVRFLQFLLLFLLNLNNWLWGYWVLTVYGRCAYSRMETLSCGWGHWNDLLLLRDWRLIPVRLWLIIHIKVFILNLFRIWYLRIVRQPIRITSILWLRLPDTAIRPHLRWILWESIPLRLKGRLVPGCRRESISRGCKIWLPFFT
jgi:hypothetical protein